MSALSLVEAFNDMGVTENGMPTNLSSLDANLDFFFLAGASRGKDIRSVFGSAMGSNLDVAVRTLLWSRDVRGGAGERQTFRNLLSYLATNNTYQYREVVRKILPLVPDVGRWDDLLVLQNTAYWQDAVDMIRKALMNGDGLCAKWMPRKGPVAVDLRQRMGMTPKTYRKTLVNLTKVVETPMCANQWDKINLEQVPSLAQIRYRNAFTRHIPGLYADYVHKVETGEAKVNAGAVFPHDIVKNLGPLADKQWEALPNYMEGNSERILPMCDVSGSMIGLPMDVSVSLGLYISERNEGVFKDTVLTFSGSPTLVHLKAKGLKNRVHELSKINWGMNTDLELAFSTILKKAKQHNVPEEQMPTMVLILSDMEFDSCVDAPNRNALTMIREEYEDAGYKLPKVVFWNLYGRQGNSPATFTEAGVALVSGFSPSVLKGILGDMSQFDPMNVMLQTVMTDRYNWQ